MQHTSTQAQDLTTGQQPTMDPEAVTAVTPLHLLDLPQELRGDIYEAAIFDLSPPEIFMSTLETYTFAYRNMSTEILLTNRKIYWEARDVIVRRGQLVMVSATRLRSRNIREPSVPMEILMGWPRVTVIHPKYRNLCVMDHRINAARSSNTPDPVVDGKDWMFIVHQRDIKLFCQALMGKFDYDVERILGPKSKHTLVLHCARGYAQHECTSFYWAQTQVLQEYRSILRGFEDVSILGSSTGWESGLYSATLKDIRSIDGKVVGRFIEDLRQLEIEGLDSMLRTGDFEAADASWVKALGVCRMARLSFRFSRTSVPTYYKRTSVESNTAWWDQLPRESGNACALLIIESWYRLIRLRLSEVLRLIQQGDHLAAKHGRAPRSTSDLLKFVSGLWWSEAQTLTKSFKLDDGWLPPPYEEAQLCLTVATIYRLLKEPSRGIGGATWAIDWAMRLAPEDEAIKQEFARIEAWRARMLEAKRLGEPLLAHRSVGTS